MAGVILAPILPLPCRLLRVDATGIGTAFQLVMGAAVWTGDRIDPTDVMQRSHEATATGVANEGNGNETRRCRHGEGLHGSRAPPKRESTARILPLLKVA